MDRPPLPAPYAVGTRLRYVGAGRWFADAEGKEPLLIAGLEVEIVATEDGWQGSLQEIICEPDDQGDDEGKYPLDVTRDGWSTWLDRRGNRRSISASNAAEWELVS